MLASEAVKKRLLAFGQQIGALAFTENAARFGAKRPEPGDASHLVLSVGGNDGIMKESSVRNRRDILVKYHARLKEEAPFAYKDITPVVRTVEDATSHDASPGSGRSSR